MRFNLALFNTLLFTAFYGMYFYFFASPFFMAIFMGITLGILYVFFVFTISFSNVSVARLLLTEIFFFTIICISASIMNEIHQMYSLYVIPFYIIFILLLAPIMNIPIIGYAILFIVIHRKLVLEGQYTIENVFPTILPFILGIVYFYTVRIA